MYHIFCTHHVLFKAKAEVELQQSRLNDVQEMLRQENSNLQSKLVSWTLH